MPLATQKKVKKKVRLKEITRAPNVVRGKKLTLADISRDLAKYYLPRLAGGTAR